MNWRWVQQCEKPHQFCQKDLIIFVNWKWKKILKYERATRYLFSVWLQKLSTCYLFPVPSFRARVLRFPFLSPPFLLASARQANELSVGATMWKTHQLCQKDIIIFVNWKWKKILKYERATRYFFSVWLQKLSKCYLFPVPSFRARVLRFPFLSPPFLLAPATQANELKVGATMWNTVSALPKRYNYLRKLKMKNKFSNTREQPGICFQSGYRNWAVNKELSHRIHKCGLVNRYSLKLPVMKLFLSFKDWMTCLSLGRSA